MSFAARAATWNERMRPRAGGGDRRRRYLAPLGTLVVLIPLGIALAEVLYRYPVGWGLAIAAAVGLAGAMTLVVGRYELAVGLGILLSGVVLVEPAPSDVLFGLIMAVALVTGRFRISHVSRAVLALVGAFVLLNLISLTAVISWEAAGRFLLITLYLAVFSLWLAGYIDRPSRAKRLVRAYLVAALFSAIVGTAALFVPFPGHELLLLGGKRAKALFKDPNVYGPFLIPITLIAAEELFRPRLLKMRTPMRALTFFVLVIGVFFSYSRAAWLNLTIGLIVLIVIVVLRRPDRKAISLVFAVAGGAIAIAAAVVVTGSLRFLHERAHEQSYDVERFASQARGVTEGLTHVFGIGPGQFNVITPEATFSLYIRALAEQGVLGLLVMGGLVLTTLLFGFMNVIRGRDTYGISAAALLGAWCGLIANSFFVDTGHWRHLWLVAALIWAGAMRERNALPALPTRAHAQHALARASPP
jgi:hypothetical protein